MRRLGNAHAQALARLVFAGRNDQRLNRRFAFALPQREKESLKSPAVHGRFTVYRIVGLATSLLGELDADEIVGDDLQPDLGALARQPLHPAYDAERPQRLTLPTHRR